MTRWTWVRRLRRWAVWTETHETALFVLVVTAMVLLAVWGTVRHG